MNRRHPREGDLVKDYDGKLHRTTRRAFVPKMIVLMTYTAPDKARYWTKAKRREWFKRNKKIYGYAIMPWAMK
jgi:hypothetical protein